MMRIEKDCSPLFDLSDLREAWRYVQERADQYQLNRRAASEYARYLDLNLQDLRVRLLRGQYSFRPGSAQIGRTFSEEMSRIEFLLVEQAAYFILYRKFDAAFRQVHYGLRPECHQDDAIALLLEYRQRGAMHFLEAGIPGLPGGLSPQIIHGQLERFVTEGNLFHLLDGWLRVRERFKGPGDRMNDHRHCASALRPDEEYREVAERVFRNALKQFGRDVLLVAGTNWQSGGADKVSARSWISPRSLGFLGGTALATAMYPIIKGSLQQRFSAPRIGFETLESEDLTELFVDLALYEVDLGLRNAGVHSVRHGHRLVFLCPQPDQFHAALKIAGEQLSKVGLLLDLSTMRQGRFDQGPTLLGYRFHPRLVAAEPICFDRPSSLDPVDDLAGNFRSTLDTVYSRLKRRFRRPAWARGNN